MFNEKRLMFDGEVIRNSGAGTGDSRAMVSPIQGNWDSMSGSFREESESEESNWSNFPLAEEYQETDIDFGDTKLLEPEHQAISEASPGYTLRVDVVSGTLSMRDPSDPNRILARLDRGTILEKVSGPLLYGITREPLLRVNYTDEDGNIQEGLVHLAYLRSPDASEMTQDELTYSALDEGESFFASRDYAGAVRAYRRAVETNPDLVPENAFYNYAYALYQRGDYVRAIVNYTSSNPDHSSSPSWVSDAYAQVETQGAEELGSLAYRQRAAGHYQEAIDIYNTYPSILERANSGNPDLYFNLIRAYRDLGNIEAALRTYEEAVANGYNEVTGREPSWVIQAREQIVTRDRAQEEQRTLAAEIEAVSPSTEIPPIEPNQPELADTPGVSLEAPEELSDSEEDPEEAPEEFPGREHMVSVLERMEGYNYDISHYNGIPGNAAVMWSDRFNPNLPATLIYHYHGTHGQDPSFNPHGNPEENRFQMSVNEYQTQADPQAIFVYGLSPYEEGSRTRNQYAHHWPQSMEEYHSEVLQTLAENSVLPSNELNLVMQGHSAGGIALKEVAEQGFLASSNADSIELVFLDATYGDWAEDAVEALRDQGVDPQVRIIQTSRNTQAGADAVANTPGVVIERPEDVSHGQALLYGFGGSRYSQNQV